MPLRWMYDASIPPMPAPDLYAAAGYIGGDTPHVWTKQEWDNQLARYRLPIFTASNREDNACAAGEDAWEIANLLAVLGVPNTATVAVDIETRLYTTYLIALNRYVWPRPLMVYGSMSTLLSNPVTSGGRWAADWTDNIATGVADVGEHDILVFQWASAGQLGKPYDLSVIDPAVPLWDRLAA